MDEEDFRNDIAELEARIEALSESIARCVKISLAARLAIGGGALWIALVLLGVIAFSPGPVVAAIAAIIGGTVLLGSNSTSWNQAEAELRAAETMRTNLIGRMQLRVVGAKTPTLH